MASKSKTVAELIEVDGDIIVAALDNVEPSFVSDKSNSSTGALGLPTGTTAQRPGSPETGYTRMNTDTGSVEFYDGANWVSTNLIPEIDSISGNIFETVATDLTLTLSNASDTISVVFKEGLTTIATVDDVSVSSGSATVTVPAAVYGQTVGDTITISITNQDGTPSSNTTTRTVFALPSGGSSTVSGTTVIQSFTSTENLVVPSDYNLTNVHFLCLAGGGGGGGHSANGYYNDGGGGGGAGGYRTSYGSQSGGNSAVESTITINSGTHLITVGGGGASYGDTTNNGRGANGGDSSIGSILTSLGGGGGATGAWSPPIGKTGGNGGSGGGAASGYDTPSAAGGTGTSGQGTNGGATDTGYQTAGGGGGAISAGANASVSSGAGGNGINTEITGSTVIRGGGGGGGGVQANGNGTGADGGSGGGGRGSDTSATNATAGGTNLGGGGGGAGGSTSVLEKIGAAGGSGVVILRYDVSGI